MMLIIGDVASRRLIVSLTSERTVRRDKRGGHAEEAMDTRCQSLYQVSFVDFVHCSYRLTFA